MTSIEAVAMFTLAATVAVLGALLLFIVTRWVISRWVAAGEKVEALADLGEPQTSDWDMHECGCLCAGGLIYPCDGHRGHAAAVLHQEAP